MTLLITQTLVDTVSEIILGAGDVILPFYKQDITIQHKSDGSPVLEADLAANQLITEKLQAIATDVRVVSEEDTSSHQGNFLEPYWLVDPLDGTKEFIHQNGEFTVNIALIEKGMPVLGLVYAPALDVLFIGSKFGAFKCEKGQNTKLCLPNQHVNEVCQVVMSRSHEGREKIIKVFPEFEYADFLGVGSSLKFCILAEGKADYYPRIGRTMEWDTAAGQGVLLAAGGDVSLFDGSPLTYGKPRLENASFLAKQNRNSIFGMPG